MTMSWTFADLELPSRLILGTSLYPSPDIMRQAITESGTGLVTVSLRRQNPAAKGGERFWQIIRELPVEVLPNTAGCKTPKEAVATAEMARELFETHLIKLELIGDDYTLQPDTTALVATAETLVAKGFNVLPYTTEDLVVARRLVDIGCRVVMPWASPIGSGQGLLNEFALTTMRARLADTALVVDAGIGRPSDAARALELGFDAVLLNSAVALATHPVKMAGAFRDAVAAGRAAWEAGLMSRRDTASPSTPTLGTPFWHQEAGA
jgi:thiazole synthase